MGAVGAWGKAVPFQLRAYLAKSSVPAGKTSTTVKGLKAGKKLWVEVRPARKSGGKSYSGILHGTWAKQRSWRIGARW